MVGGLFIYVFMLVFVLEFVLVESLLAFWIGGG